MQVIKQPKYLMNPATGSVDTEENWKAEMPTWTSGEAEILDPERQQEQFDSLIEVVKDKNGDWVEPVDYAAQLGTEFAEELNDNPVAAQNWRRLEPSDSIPEEDYRTLVRECGECSSGMEASYKKAFNNSFETAQESTIRPLASFSSKANENQKVESSPGQKMGL